MPSLIRRWVFTMANCVFPRLGARSGRRPCRGPGKLEAGAQRTRTSPCCRLRETWQPVPLRPRPSPRWRRAWGSQTAPSRVYRNYSQYRALGHSAKTRRLLLRCSGSIQCSIRCAAIRAFRNSLPLHRTRRTNKAKRSSQQSRRRANWKPCCTGSWEQCGR